MSEARNAVGRRRNLFRRGLDFLRTLRKVPGTLLDMQQQLLDMQQQLLDMQQQLETLRTRARELESRSNWLEQNHRANIDWLQQTYPDIVAAIGDKVGQAEWRGLQERLQQLEQNHRANIDWLQQTYPDIVAAIGRKIEQEQLHELSEQLFAGLYRELAATRQHPSAAAPAQPATAPEAQAAGALGPVQDDFYLDLEKRFRGTRAELQQRLQPYLDFLKAANLPQGSLLDLGCGRGEWLELLARERIPATGVDLNPINGAACRQSGLTVVTDFAEQYLQRQPENSLAAVTSFQLVEHLEFMTLQQLLELSFRALQPGGVLIMETPNPENLQVACHSFWIDPTHQRPLPPALLEFMVQRLGFVETRILRLNPCENYDPSAPEADSQRLLYGPRDYAILARKPATH